MVADALLSFAGTQNGALGNVLRAAGVAQRKVNYEQLELANFLKDDVALSILDTYDNGMHCFTFELFLTESHRCA